jgi:hypothetical protein
MLSKNRWYDTDFILKQSEKYKKHNATKNDTKTRLWVFLLFSGDRILVGARFSVPIQTGPGAHPASCTMDTGYFPRGKERPGRNTDPSPPSSDVVMKE